MSRPEKQRTSNLSEQRVLVHYTLGEVLRTKVN